MNYEMGGTILSKTVKEKDMGVTMNANMIVLEQYRIAASKGNQILRMIRRNITYKEKSLIIPLYKTIVRPHLEYCTHAWNPHLRKDVDMLEKIQRRATKLIPELRDLTYEERLKECGLTTLETRRLRGDQISVVVAKTPESIRLEILNTRFNKIAIQGTPQMAVDKEALICLSRVYSYYFKYNFPLFYVYPALTRYLSILFLNILTLLACTHSSDNVFHTLMVICENENFLTSNLLCFFTRVKLCPLVILLSLIWKKKG